MHPVATYAKLEVTLYVNNLEVSDREMISTFIFERGMANKAPFE